MLQYFVIMPKIDFPDIEIPRDLDQRPTFFLIEAILGNWN